MQFWKKQRDKAIAHRLIRSIHLQRGNLDYQIKYPNESADNPNNVIKTSPHPEAKIRITKEFATMMKRANVPSVIRPKRLNRVG